MEIWCSWDQQQASPCEKNTRVNTEQPTTPYDMYNFLAEKNTRVNTEQPTTPYDMYNVLAEQKIVGQ
jgi:hypothetical protein